MTPQAPIRLYWNARSGHAHRVQLFLSILELPFELIDVDLQQGEHKSPAFLAKNAFGQVPVIEDGDIVLADSHAILVYLALRYDATRRWYPPEPTTAAEIQRWLAAAAGPLAYGPSRARLIRLLGAPLDHELAKRTAEQLFGVMEQHLDGREYFVGRAPTIADIALYTYTARAPEGDITLEPYPQIRAWLERIEALPHFVPMPEFAPA